MAAIHIWTVSRLNCVQRACKWVNVFFPGLFFSIIFPPQSIVRMTGDSSAASAYRVIVSGRGVFSLSFSLWLRSLIVLILVYYVSICAYDFDDNSNRFRSVVVFSDKMFGFVAVRIIQNACVYTLQYRNTTYMRNRRLTGVFKIVIVYTLSTAVEAAWNVLVGDKMIFLKLGLCGTNFVLISGGRSYAPNRNRSVFVRPLRVDNPGQSVRGHTRYA